MTQSLRELAMAIHRQSGIHLSDSQLGTVTAALKRMDPALTPERVLGEADSRARARLIHQLVDRVTVNETFFFRNREELDRIDWHGLLAAARAEGRLGVRIWSAACSSGEEAYTLAMLAAEALGGPAAPLEVVGTDISPTILAQARSGVYGPRSTRLVSREQQQRWFVPSPQGLRVGDALRAFVRFEEGNLVHGIASAVGDAPYDVVVCRNVLIYFDPDTVKRVIADLQGRVTATGRLILGAADRLGALPPARPPRISGTRDLQRKSPPTAPAVPVQRVRAAPAPPVQAPIAPEPAALMAFDAGVRALGEGEPARAVDLLRRSLYLDPGLTVAALQLGRAHEASGDRAAARRAYALALRQASSLEPSVRLHDRIGAGDVANACRARLAATEGT